MLLAGVLFRTYRGGMRTCNQIRTEHIAVIPLEELNTLQSYYWKSM